MNIGAMFIVKNEENRIEQAILPLVDKIPEIMVVDTGSTDGTKDILKNRFGLEAIDYKVPANDPFNIVNARNFGIERMQTEWVFTLDADEVVNSETVDALVQHTPSSSDFGYFMRWIDHRRHEPFEDYKLFIFRNDERLRFLGKAHSVPQSAIRAVGKSAAWFDGEVKHFPENNKVEHRMAYRDQLREGITEEPTWYRYHWFLGYSLIKDGNVEEGKRYLQAACKAKSLMFPVETLNSFMVLISLESKEGNFNIGLDTLNEAREFYREVHSDFEVQVNFRISGWIDDAEEQLRAEQSVIPYEFAY